MTKAGSKSQNPVRLRNKLSVSSMDGWMARPEDDGSTFSFSYEDDSVSYIRRVVKDSFACGPLSRIGPRPRKTKPSTREGTFEFGPQWNMNTLEIWGGRYGKLRTLALLLEGDSFVFGELIELRSWHLLGSKHLLSPLSSWQTVVNLFR